MNDPVRHSDAQPESHTRTDRLFLKSGLWYFRTREGDPVGPFRYRDEAEAMMARFLHRLREAERRQRERTLRPKPKFRTSATL
ncbi:MAG: DUF6316 family protein [Pseudomonadota bacterium]